MSDPSTSAQEAAVDACGRAFHDVDQPLIAWDDDGEDEEGVRQWYRNAAAVIIDALLQPTKKPCAECGEGAGRVRGPADDAIEKATGWPHSLTYKCPNPDCTDGFVASPAPIEGLGWVKASERDVEELAAFRRECDAVGIPHDPAGLVRHHRGNAGLAAAAQRTADLLNRLDPETRAKVIAADRLPSKVDES